MIEAVLDHLAVAAESQHDLWPRYAGDLAGEWIGGGVAPGFGSYQVKYANGMKLEILEPDDVERNDFLRRFLDRNGPGPHHITYKVPDIDAAMAEVRAAGFDLVGVDLSSPDWKEAFIHPKQGFGIVVQLAQSSGNWGPDAAPAWLPKPAQPTATLERIVHRCVDLAATLGLFRDVLGGETVREDAGAVELSFRGPGRIRFEQATDDGALAHLDGREGRLHHLDLTVDDPTLIADARQEPDRWVVPADQNFGVALHLRPRNGTPPSS